MTSPRKELYIRHLYQFYQIYKFKDCIDLQGYEGYLKLRYDSFFHYKIKLHNLPHLPTSTIYIPSFLHNGVNDMSFWADRNTFKSYLDTFDVLLTQIKSRAYCGTPEVIQLAHQLEMGASVKSLFPQLPFTVVRSNKKRIFLNHSCLFYPTKPYSPSPVISGITIKNKSARIVDFLSFIERDIEFSL